MIDFDAKMHQVALIEFPLPKPRNSLPLSSRNP
jgi:hypothetical protein